MTNSVGTRRDSLPVAAHAVEAVHVVDDDDDVREATARLLTIAGYVVKTYASASEFLVRLPTANPGCVVVEVRLPGPSGLDLQQVLADAHEPLPIVFVTGCGDIPMTVRAIKAGAVDFLPKPVPGDVLLRAVGQAMARGAQERGARARERTLHVRHERLTPREREVLGHVVSGQLNKQIAYDLGIAERTVKAHRKTIMQKLEVDTIADLVRVSSELHIAPVHGQAEV